MTYQLAAAFLWSWLILSIMLTPEGFDRRSWKLLWLAGLLSFAFSLPAALSIGPVVWLLTAVQVAGAVAFRWRLSWSGWANLMLLGILIWLVVVPANLLLFHWPPLVFLVPLAMVAAAVATLRGPSEDRATER
ncbi:MAG TPA: hypothetical protein VFI42_07885 [Thermomicrobiaceae bacterium]|nr:hypothetical protein [Thermomicrobiaceae bacterium]